VRNRECSDMREAAFSTFMIRRNAAG
jgi:hypothetical protein